MKKVVSLICCFCLIAVLQVTAAKAAPAPKPITLKYSSHGVASDWLEQYLNDHLFKVITKRTNGQVQFQIYLGGSLLSANEAPAGTAKGIADITRIACATTPGLFPLSMFLTMPGLNIDPIAGAKALMDLYGSSQFPQYREEWDKLNLRLLHPHLSPRTGFGVKGKIKDARDLKGKNIRVFGSDWPVVLSEAYGVNPVGLAWSEVVDGLMRGTIDGLISPINTHPEHKLGQYIGTMLNGDLGLPNLSVVAMGTRSWNALPDDVKQVFVEENASFIEYLHRNWHAMAEKTASDYWASMGVAIYEMTAAEKAQMTDPISKVWQKSTADLEKRGIPAGKLLEFYQAAKGGKR